MSTQMRWAFGVILTVMLLSAGGMATAIEAYGLRLRKLPIYPAGDPPPTLNSLPTETRSWVRVGKDEIVPVEMVEELGTENYLTRTFVRRDTLDTDAPMAVQLHAAYYTGMIDTVPHVPDRCFVGGGMQIVGGPRVVPLPLEMPGWRDETMWPEGLSEEQLGGLQGRVKSMPIVSRQTSRATGESVWITGGRVRSPLDLEDLAIKITSFDAGAGPGPALFAGYFFLANGGLETRAEGVRLLAFKLEDDYAYYLKVQFTSWTVENEEELAAAAGSLLDELLPHLMTCVPDWVDVQAGQYPEPDGLRTDESS